MAKGSEQDRPIYVISIAAELAGVHPQTLRVYERKGLVQPKRTSGNSRRYSQRDIQLLKRIQDLTNEGINLAGVMRILELEQEIESLRRHVDSVTRQASSLEDQLHQAMEARDASAIVRFSEVRRVRRAMKSDIVDQLARRRTFPVPPVGGDTGNTEG
ncbi:MAG: heat shock protein transcriptional repressor HspR [Actinomycetota bacterium]